MMTLSIAEHRRSRPRGFTLIEMMFTVVILALLVALLTGAYKYVNRSARAHSTRLTLNNLQAMYAATEADAGANMPNIVAQIYPPANSSTPATVAAPQDVSRDSWDASPLSSDRYCGISIYGSGTGTSNAVYLTQQLMAVLRRTPSNQSAVTQLPADQFLRNPVVMGNTPLDPPVILDGWGNPIIFVPSGGLTGVWRSSSTTVVTIVAPDNRPFWASAGPNGKFTGSPSAVHTTSSTFEGDDNVYSFEN
jgi:prepilin-type N-terminal cleavage/methylation domain-containing protein